MDNHSPERTKSSISPQKDKSSFDNNDLPIKEISRKTKTTTLKGFMDDEMKKKVNEAMKRNDY